jgi:hypothetical protein
MQTFAERTWMPKIVSEVTGCRIYRANSAASGNQGQRPALSERAFSVVEFQGAHIPAEWLLQLGGLLRRPARHRGDLGISGVLVHS